VKLRGVVLGASSILVGTSLTLVTYASGRFDRPLSSDQRIVHAINRLTFGPKPGDVDRVRRLGLKKWIDLQLHPEQIAEPPSLDAKLGRLKTPGLQTWQILEQYPQNPVAIADRPPSVVAFQTLPPQQMSRLVNGSVDERIRTFESLDDKTRRLVLGGVPPQALEGLPPEMQEEAAATRKAEQDERQMEVRRLMPPIAELLTADERRIATTGTPDQKRALLDSFDADKRKQVLRVLPPQALAATPDLRREALALGQPPLFVNGELIEQKLDRAVYSNRQLQEVLVDFWMNHFNIFNGKGPDRELLTSFERDAIRPYVFGRFEDMLVATARHPAMLFYLDNWQSQSPRDDVPVPRGVQRPGLNENYGRELMELHTLGVDGGYTQADVVAVARAFTGWTIYDPQKYAEFQFNPAVHDRKEKVVLGETIPAMGAEEDGLKVLHLLAHHPSTAKFISRQLAQRFVADDPPQPLVDRMAATFTKSDGDLRAVLQTLFASPEFFSEGAWRAKVKSPLEMAVSSLRALDADMNDAFVLAQRIADLGEPLYGKQDPNGYPNTGDAWANTASLLGRLNFAAALAGNQMPGVTVDLSRWNFERPAVMAGALLGYPASPATLAVIDKSLQGREATPSALTTLILGSPDFQKR
jgi:uncharacterized protein (DUF1800 family)